MPTTFDKTNGSPAFSLSSVQKTGVLHNRVTVTETTINADIIQALDIPAGTYVSNVVVRVIAPSTGAVTAKVGDGAGNDSWDASTNLNASAATTTVGAGGTDTYVTTGKLYSADDTIDLTVSGAAAGAVFDIFAICANVNV